MVGWVENIDQHATSKGESKKQDLSKKNYQARFGEDDKPTDENVFQKSIGLFLERVTIAGLEDVRKLKIRAEKCMWFFAYVLACFGLVITCKNVANQYIDPPIVYDDFPVQFYQAPFPNVTICSPEAIDRDKLRQQLVIPEKVKNLAKRKNITLDDLINQALDNWH